MSELLRHYFPIIAAFTALLVVIVPANRRIAKLARAELKARREAWEQNRADELRQRWLAPEVEKEAA